MDYKHAINLAFTHRTSILRCFLYYHALLELLVSVCFKVIAVIRPSNSPLNEGPCCRALSHSLAEEVHWDGGKQHDAFDGSHFSICWDAKACSLVTQVLV
jgi:hypothetical protein